MPGNLNLITLVWLSLKPLIKVIISGCVGFGLVRFKDLDETGLKTIAQVQIVAALPFNLFFNIVPSITTQNSHGILVCIAFALFYTLLGYILAHVLLRFVSVPDNFRHGFIVAAIWSNWGNLPLSVIQSIMAGPPFGKPGQINLGFALGSFFAIVHSITMFVGPGTRMIEKDFEEKPQSIHPEPSSLGHPTLRNRLSIISAEYCYSDTEESALTSQVNRSDSLLITDQLGETAPLLGLPEVNKNQPLKKSRVESCHHLISPVNVALVVATVIAVVPALKHLFVNEDYHHLPTASGDEPILSVFLDSAKFLGASAMPLALIVTGASFGRMSVPRSSWSSLPFGAMFGLAVAKLIIMPLFGFGAVSLLKNFTNIFEGKDGQVLQFVCFYYSCTVISTNQISLTTIAAGDSSIESNVDLLCAFIIIQYLIYLVAGTFVITLGLKMLS
ncbi:hypothetical protein O181_013629 [Austropuccinia psidii MF-1]|uniref:Auxin efflux carrier n=1 Tax=Austropuccinia psidii MF-1 TaxID=1389203 RepID=A0A9Q3BYM3_9BASI|nr:hypothetical protein [Austropuccinia psidii MF-1]